jgi:hypothetical protein
LHHFHQQSASQLLRRRLGKSPHRQPPQASTLQRHPSVTTRLYRLR